jgi:hypothetical protein
MAAIVDGEADLENLREDLTCDLNVLLGDLKGLRYDQSQIPAFLNETRAQPLDIKITKLRKQIARMQRIKDSIHQNSTSALSLSSALSEDSSTKKLKRAHPENLSFGNQVQSAALARMQRIKDSIHQDSTGALSLSLAPSEDSSTKN